MEHTTSRGHRIAFDVSGQGPAVLLQHGLFSRRGSWHANGFVDALARDLRVVTVDSLGHGDSDKPADPQAYQAAARADDLAAVLDAVGVRRAHVVGYSMGSWMGIAFAARHPARLRSLTLGGWDPVGGVAAAGSSRALDFETILAGVRTRAPEVAGWITPEATTGLRACWEALAARLSGATFRAVPGDHLGAMTTHAAASIAVLRAFLAEPGAKT